MSRRGSIQVELLIAIVALIALGGIAVESARDRRLAATIEERAAAVETARNLLARVRAGLAVETPAGWRLERKPLAGGTLVTVHGAGFTLSTVAP